MKAVEDQSVFFNISNIEKPPHTQGQVQLLTPPPQPCQQPHLGDDNTLGMRGFLIYSNWTKPLIKVEDKVSW